MGSCKLKQAEGKMCEHEHWKAVIINRNMWKPVKGIVMDKVEGLGQV